MVKKRFPGNITQALVSSRQRVVDPEELLASIIREFGGTPAFGREIVREFRTAPEGGIVRKGLLEMINRLVTFTFQEKGAGQSVEDIDTADLEAVLKQFAGPDDDETPPKDDGVAKDRGADPGDESAA